MPPATTRQLAAIAAKHRVLWGRAEGDGLLASFMTQEGAEGFAADVRAALPALTLTMHPGEVPAVEVHCPPAAQP